MNHEDQVRAALRALADHDRPRESATPAAAIFTLSQTPRGRTPLWFGSIGLAAAATLVFFLRPTAPPTAPPQQYVAEVVPGAPLIAELSAKPVERPKRVRAAAPPREVATDFFLLSDTPAPFVRGQVLRVLVPALMMRDVGLPVRPERWADSVQADVLVGEEGLPHAIRFVSFEN